VRALAWSVAFALALALVSMQVTRAEVDGDRFESQEWGVRITAPANWRMSQQTSYPNIILWMHRHSPPGTMLLSAERLASKQSSLEYAERTSKTLTELGFTVRAPQVHAATGAYWLEFDDGKTYLRQALLVTDGIGYSLTLSAPDSTIRTQHLRGFDYALRSIKLDRARSAPGQVMPGDSPGQPDAPRSAPPASAPPAGDPPAKDAP
jgi:hypothetical protein